MKIIKKNTVYGDYGGDYYVLFEVPSSMRTISIILNNCVERFHVSLPVMRFMSYGSCLDNLFLLSGLKGVFLDRDGEVCPIILPNVDIIGSVCLGDMERHYRGANLDVITDEIYSNFIQSHFSSWGAIKLMYMYEDVVPEEGLEEGLLCDKIKEFYTEWSSRGRNYDICSDVRVKSYRDMVCKYLDFRFLV